MTRYGDRTGQHVLVWWAQRSPFLGRLLCCLSVRVQWWQRSLIGLSNRPGSAVQKLCNHNAGCYSEACTLSCNKYPTIHGSLLCGLHMLASVIELLLAGCTIRSAAWMTVLNEACQHVARPANRRLCLV
jgi:hypothetical protein